MNIEKVRNSAAFVNYVKPQLEMVDLEVENSLLLTASGGGFGTGGEDPSSDPDGGKGAGGTDLKSSRPKIRR
jgi:hypothetical protein